jgi:hypothetical protein
MGEVTGYTAERMKAIEDASVVNGGIDANGHLILVRHDTSEIDAGLVKTLVTATEGPPTTGTWIKGDYIIDSIGRTWICVTAGSPGQWVTTGGTLLDSAISTIQQATTATGTAAQAVDVTGLSVTFKAPAQPVRLIVCLSTILNNTAGGIPTVYLTKNDNTELSRWKAHNTAANEVATCNIDYLLEGLTPGTEYTYKVKFCAAVASTTTIFPVGTPSVSGHLLAVAA